MAKYARELLVPYLQNVCSLELAHRKLKEQEFLLTGEANRLRNGIHPAEKPKKPYIEPRSPGGTFWLVMGIITFLFSFLMMSLDLNFMGWFCLLGGIGEGILGYVLIKSVNDSNADKQFAYERKLAEYNEIQRKNAIAKDSRLSGVLDELRKCQLEIKKVMQTLQKAYSVNVIPLQYRNIYAAIYLYDHFAYSRADDLDAALQLFVLEEIKAKLDKVIANQYTMILNQQIEIANQQRTLELQQAHSAMMREKLDRSEASNEDRNMYLSMIESNTSTIAYFATADYIRKI